MKTLITCIALLCLFANVSIAQLASTDYSISSEIQVNRNSVEKNNSKDLELAALIAEKHTHSAEKQLKNYLSGTLEYSDILIENGVEGELIVVVDLAVDGKLASFSILKSPHGEVTKMVSNALQNLTAVNFKNHWYRGSNQIEIPLRFSIK